MSSISKKKKSVKKDIYDVFLKNFALLKIGKASGTQSISK